MASGGKQNLGASVVPDLMRVYESLTQSKTPQVLPENRNNNANDINGPEAGAGVTAANHNSHTNQNVGVGANANAGAGAGVHNLAQPSTATLTGHPQQQQQQQHQVPYTAQQQQHVNTNVALGTSSSVNVGVREVENPFQFDPNVHNFHTQQFLYPSATPNTGVQLVGSANVVGAVPSSNPNINSSTTTTTPKNTRPKRGSTRKRTSASVDADKSGSDSNSTDSKRKKKGGRDARWSKRFAWPDELHRDFVSAVFDVGLKHSSPSAILEQMPKHEQITSERIKSHLQKYRLHRQKSKKEFMNSYTSTILKMKAGEIDSDPSSLNSGEVAAHLSYVTMQEAEMASANNATDTSALLQGGVLQLPQLTDAEKRSPLGASMGYLMGLFFSLKQQLLAQRSGDVFSSTPGMPLTSRSLDTSQSSTFVPDQFLQTHIPPSSSLSSVPTPIPAAIPCDSSDAPSPQTTQQSQQQSSVLSQPLIPIQQQQHGMISSSQPKKSQDLSNSAKSNVHMGNPAPAPDSRINNPVVEESKMMKREMESQMAFQNKMRKLKEQELNKYTVQATGFEPAVLPSSTGIGGGVGAQGGDDTKQDDSQRTTAIGSSDAAAAAAVATATSATTSNVAAKGSESAGMNDADFWTSGEIMDDQLFQFLMNE